MRLICLFILAAFVAPALAEDPPLPRPRPEAPAPKAESAGNHEAAPRQSEPRLFQTACPAVIGGQVIAKPLPPIDEKSCEVCSPLALKAVTVRGRSVPVNGDAVTNCQMATALSHWLDAVDGYAAAHDKTRIAAVNVGTSYMCRARVTGTANDTPSEHGFADALDVTGFTLEDGRTIRVETAWPGDDDAGRSLIRFAHDAACAAFTTVLGPEANALHRNHLHVDLGCHGRTCTVRLCE